MKIKLLLSALFLCSSMLLINIKVYAQEKLMIVAKFIIQDARINRVDFSEYFNKNKCLLIIYTDKNSEEVYFSNFNKGTNTFSSGRVFDLEQENFDATAKSYRIEVTSFKWAYSNSYDDKKGTATVRLTKIYKEAGVAFECTIVPENLDILDFKGYMYGSLKN